MKLFNKKIGIRFKYGLRSVMPHILIFVLILLFFIIYLAPYIFITVRAGESAVLWRRFFGGTETDRVYGEGWHMIWPWDKMTIYNVRIQEVRPSIDVLTKRGLKINLLISIRYHPERDILGVLHQRVGTNYVDKIVIPEVESTLRTTIGTLEIDEVYGTKRTMLHQILNEALEQVTRSYVKIDDVIIRKVELPDFIKKAIEAKLEQKQLSEAYEFKLERERKEAERKEIEASGYARYNQIITVSLNDQLLKWQGIQATRELASSTNAKVVVIGNGPKGLPVILGGQ